MASPTEVANMALAHLGVTRQISDLDTDTTVEAKACRTFFEVSKKAVLSDFDWPLATKYAELSLVEEDPNDEWGYSYRYPSDCLFARKILSGNRNDTRQTRVPYQEGSDATGRLIFTDMEDAVLKYTRNVTDISIFPAEMAIAHSYRLAVYLAPMLTAGDPFRRAEVCMQLYRSEVDRASAHAANSVQDDELPECEFLEARL